MVIIMNFLHDIVLTEIRTPVKVWSQNGFNGAISNRKAFGFALAYYGQRVYFENGVKIVLKHSKALLIPKGASYTFKSHDNGCFPLIDFECENFNCDTITAFDLDNPEKFLKIFEKMKQLSLFKENKLLLYSEFYKMLNLLTPANTVKGNAFDLVIKHIEKNISDSHLSNNELAQIIGYSEVHFRKQFLKVYKITPKQYVLNIRIQKAMQLLTETHSNVSVIAEKCGFSSPYHFCRTFKEKTGMTPTQYAKENTVLLI